MGIEYYGFALFVFVLICIIIILCKRLFADVKAQRKLLEDKEIKLLQIYQTLEDAMDEFYDLVAESKSELDEKYRSLYTAVDEAKADSAAPGASERAVIAPEQEDGLSDPAKRSALEEAAGRRGGFGEILAESAGHAAEEEEEAMPAERKHESIIEMAKDGMSRAEIAKTLKITQNEVDLVIGMNKITE